MLKPAERIKIVLAQFLARQFLKRGGTGPRVFMSEPKDYFVAAALKNEDRLLTGLFILGDYLFARLPQ